ncbi:hypothetical protein F8388_024778 [Cannabis sativa]|uniref:Uncharacterized protein n=1 Tax=Cannabis sativa TaxID=3483 RepID=A0A7J6DZG1_CANSA|nr:hypothetical protein F8388_024778 [Cannabis sativa]
MMSILFVVGFMFMLLFSTTANVVNSYESSNTPQCIPKEREALLKFKTTLNDSEGDLSTWSNNSTTQNCCEWRHISCDDQTNHVVYVEVGGIYTLGGEIDSSLAELHHLNTLNLYGMNISHIPKFIGSFKELSFLNLYDNPISGIIPPQLGNLTQLESLHLESTSQMIIDNPEWLSQLTSLKKLWLSNCRLLKVPDHTSSSSLSHSNYSFTSLQYLEISQSFIHPTTITWLLNSTINLEFIRLGDNNLSGTLLHNLLGNISSSTRNSLHYLYLSSNQLGGLILNDFENTFPSLTDLYLDNNKLEGHFPNRLKTFPNLKTLDISDNQFIGVLPDLSSMPNLISFKASNNKFSGTSSESIGKLDNLSYLDVSSNRLTGYISHVVNLQCPSLKYLDISYNIDMLLKFNSKYPIIPSFNLATINLASCKLGPELPNWLLTQTNLKHLDVSNSSISGPLPNWFPNITFNLKYLNMSHNLLSNTLANFSLSQENNVIVDLSSNQFQGSVPPSLLVNTTRLYLSNNKFTEFSSSLCEAKEQARSTEILDLSNNNLFDNIPNCWENFTQLVVLNLGYNKLFGNIPNSINMTSIKTLQLRHNNFSGKFPSSLKYCTSLEVLDLGSNSLEGSIPSWIGEELNNLVFLSLKSNKFYGSIPLSLCQLTQIQILDFSSNDLSGPIPSCIKNFTAMVQINSSETTISSHIKIRFRKSCGLDRACNLGPVSYENNASITWKGAQHEYVKILGLLRVIDLSSNKLNGEIPMEVTHLSQLGALNLSRNNLSGKIPRKIGKLTNLQVLDFSYNKINGEIPTSLAEVSSLSYLDLSNNRLSGRIPIGTQLQSFNASSYSMNLGLCGNPLPSSCPGDDDDESSHVPASNSAHDHDNDGEWFDLSWFYKGIRGGFTIGFCGVCGNLLINKSWRASYFRLMQNIGDWLYVVIIIKWNFLRKKFLGH